VNPALPSQTGLPHVKVVANQDIQVEWVNGHESDCYWVLTSEQDSFKNLLKINTRVLDEYISNAPAAQQVPPPARWQKYHRKYDSVNLDNKAGDSFFQAVIKPTDNNNNYILRPDVFEGRFTGVRGSIANANASLVYQMVYKSGTSCTSNDRRVQYKNAQFPWIIAVHRYRLCTGQAGRPDVARPHVSHRHCAWPLRCAVAVARLLRHRRRRDRRRHHASRQAVRQESAAAARRHSGAVPSRRPLRVSGRNARRQVLPHRDRRARLHANVRPHDRAGVPRRGDRAGAAYLSSAYAGFQERFVHAVLVHFHVPQKRH
jgi:hypothetical protein